MTDDNTYRGGTKHIDWESLRPQLEELSSLSYTQSEIAAILGVSVMTINKQLQHCPGHWAVSNPPWANSKNPRFLHI
jgi:hypothetical protein